MDVTSMLNMYALNAGSDVDKIQKMSDSQRSGKTESRTGEQGETFSSLLDGEIAELSQSRSLADALDGTVLKGLTDYRDLSAEMLKTAGGQMMMQELMKGQYASIVTADPEEEEEKEKTSLAETVLDSQRAGQTTDVDALLEKMQSLVDRKNIR
ncbi:MAG: hypothetical protein ACI4F8_03990 [Lachnospiraceae bacterium]